MSRSVLGIFIMVVGLTVAFIASVVKTRHEVEGRWRSDYSREWVDLASQWNPSLDWPNPDDIASGRQPVRPMPKPERASTSARVRLDWPHDLVAVKLEESGQGGAPFIESVVGDFRALAQELPPKERK